MKNEDPIVNEVRQIRDAHAAQHGYDLKKIFVELKQTQKDSGKSYKKYPARPVKVSMVKERPAEDK